MPVSGPDRYGKTPIQTSGTPTIQMYIQIGQVLVRGPVAPAALAPITVYNKRQML